MRGGRRGVKDGARHWPDRRRVGNGGGDSFEDGSEDEAEDLPLHRKRPFGAGLKRKKVEFVPATNPDDAIAAASEDRKSTSVSDLYASVVLAQGGQEKAQAPTNSTRDVEEPEGTDEPGSATPPFPPATCPVCSLPIATTLAEHNASLAHQVSLAHSHPPSALDRSRMGLRALALQGWDPDARRGLGHGGEGIRFPVKALAKDDTLGVGAKFPEASASTREKRGTSAPAQVRTLNAREMRKLAKTERKRGVRLQREIYGSVDVERYLKGDGKDQDI